MNTTYKPSLLNIILHSIPRLSLKLEVSQRPNFCLSNNVYLEGLLTIAMVPAAILLLTMLSFLIYYCWVKFRRSKSTEVKSSFFCSSCLVFFFLLVILGGIAVATYGSLIIGSGIDQSLIAMAKTNYSLSSISFNVKGLNLFLDSIKLQTHKLLLNLPGDENVQTLLKLANQLQAMFFDFPKNTDNVVNSLEEFVSYVQMADSYRFMITFCGIGLVSIVCFLAILGICFRSKFCLAMTTISGQLCLIGSYIYMCILFAVVFGIADLCIDPISYLEIQTRSKLSVSNSTIDFYQHCMTNKTLDMPYSNTIEKSQSLLGRFPSIIGLIEQNELPYKVERLLYDLNMNVDNIKNKLEKIKIDFKCNRFNSPLDQFVISVCKTGFQGVGVTILSVFGVCFGLTVMLCAVPRVWKKLSIKPKTENEYQEPPYARGPIYRSWTVERNPLQVQSNNDVGSSVINPPIMSLTKKLPPRSCDYQYQYQTNPPPYSQFH